MVAAGSGSARPASGGSGCCSWWRGERLRRCPGRRAARAQGPLPDQRRAYREPALDRPERGRCESISRPRAAPPTRPIRTRASRRSTALLDTFERIRRIPLPSDSLLGPSTLNIGTIQGGVAPNVFHPAPGPRRISGRWGRPASSSVDRRGAGPRRGHDRLGRDPRLQERGAGRLGHDVRQPSRAICRFSAPGAGATSSGPARFASPIPMRNGSARRTCCAASICT